MIVELMGPQQVEWSITLSQGHIIKTNFGGFPEGLGRGGDLERLEFLKPRPKAGGLSLWQ